jgi:hypothetical protein
MMKRLSLAAAAAAVLAACGGSSHSGPNIACNFAADAQCDEVSGPQVVLDAFNFNAAGCASSNGVVVSSCPASGRVGRCTTTITSAGVSGTMVSSFYAPTWTAVTVQSDCVSNGGTFSTRQAAAAGGWGGGASTVEASFEAE